MTPDKPLPTVTSFAARTTVEQVEEGLALAPKFDADGLIPCITTDANSGEVLMLGHMNGEALQKTMTTGRAHYWSRGRQCLWRKGETSGLVQEVVEIRIDDDQDAVWLRVRVAGSGASCHVGYRSCFYRSVEPGGPSGEPARLVFTEPQKTFDPKAVYGDAPTIHASRPTRLPKMRAPHDSALASCTLHVCTSCRAPGSPREPRESRAGFRLYEELRATLREGPNGSHVEVRPAECLSMCKRPCGIALSSSGAWTYLFGDQRPGENARDILECVSLYIGSADGFMPRERRPKSCRASVLGRVPPFEVGR